MEKKILKFIQQNNLIPDDIKTVYVAVSGGADSMALLAFMHKNVRKTIVGVHVNHGIRGVSADRDEAFVFHYCYKHNIPCFIFNAKAEGVVIPANPSEDWARNLRYQFFETLPMENAVIATAHTASDQLETMLFRLARGCGMNGLTGIPAKRGNIIRPFLELTTQETRQLTEYYETQYMTDESNLTDAYARNKIRHHVVPVLKDINPQAERNTVKTCDRVAKAFDFISQAASEAIEQCQIPNTQWFHTEKLAQQHPAVLEQMVIQILDDKEIGDGIIEKVTDAIYNCRHFDAAEYKLLDTPINNYQSVVVTNKTFGVKTKITPYHLNYGINKFGTWGHGIKIEQVNYEQFVKDTQDIRQLAFYVDGDRFAHHDMIAYSKANGDRFKPARRYETKVSNHLHGYMFEKQEMPVVKNKEGKVIYLHDVGFTDGMLPTETTKIIYKFTSY